MTKTTTIDPKLINQLLEQTPPEDLLGENGLIKQFAKAIPERALQAEMSTHLGHEPGESVSNEAGNKRNGTTSQTVQGELGKLEMSVPRDREGTFEPQLVKKRQTRLRGLDTRIVNLYAKGMSTREIQSQLVLGPTAAPSWPHTSTSRAWAACGLGPQEMDGVDVSAGLISNVTDAVNDEIKTWQSRPLEAI